MMLPESIFQIIREKKLWGISSDEIKTLVALDQSAYDEVVRQLMDDIGDYARSQPNYHYQDVYDCQIAGCCLYAMRPNRDLYEAILQGSLKIADPSSCRDAVAALRRVKSSSEIAVDFLNLIDLYKTIPDGDEIISRIMDMFYWLGTSPAGLQSDMALPGYVISTLLGQWIQKGLLLLGDNGFEAGPLTELDEAMRVSELILETMLSLFEANNSNQTARSIISQLPFPDKDYLLPHQSRIIQAYVSASNSSDEYVRHRVSDPKSRELIESVNQ